MTAVKSEYHLDEETGQRSVNSRMVGTTDDNDVDAGVVVVSPVSGDYQQFILDPDDADAANVDAERIQDATGFKAFKVTPLTPSAIANIKAIIYGWSTSAGDLTAVNANMALQDVDITTPSGGGSANPDVGSIFPVGAASGTQNDWKEQGWVVWDRATTIKTIAVRSVGADYTTGVLVEVIK